jgi:hypothetical protein
MIIPVRVGHGKRTAVLPSRGRFRIMAPMRKSGMNSPLAILSLILLLVLLSLLACKGGKAVSSATATLAPPVTQTPEPQVNLCDPVSQAPALQEAADIDLQTLEYAACHRLMVQVTPGPAPQIAVVQDTLYRNRSGSDLDALVFRLLANTPGAEPNVTLRKVSIGQLEVAHQNEAEGTALSISLPSPLAQGSSVAVHLEYDVKVPVNQARGYGTFNYQDGMMLLSGFYAMPAVLENGRWNVAIGPDYGDATYSEVGLFSVDITAPTTYTVVTSGCGTGRIANGDSTTTWRYVSGPMRDFMVVLSDRLEPISTTVGHVTVNSYYLPGDKIAAEAVLQEARNALRAYQQAFGVYPYSEFDAVEAPVPGGMEYPGLVLLGRDAYGESNEYLEFVVAHEVAHQWWYGLVGNDQVNVPWLDESLANFSVLYYYEHSYGRERAELAFKTYVTDSYTRALELGRDAAVNQPVNAFGPQDYGPIVYGKGALFFYHVREQLGSEAMLDALRAYLQRYRFKLVTGDDLLAVLGGTSGENLSQLYEKWIL